jgi:hypothetical protein
MFQTDSGLAPPPTYDSVTDETAVATSSPDADAQAPPPEYRPDIPMFVRTNSGGSHSEPPVPSIATVWMPRPQPVPNCMPGFEFLAHLNKITAHQNFNRLPDSKNFLIIFTFLLKSDF